MIMSLSFNSTKKKKNYGQFYCKTTSVHPFVSPELPY